MNYSVLMSVYKKEKASYLETAIESILNQTKKTNDFVILCDGPLTEELDNLLNKYKKNPIFNIVRFEENRGLGTALNEGIHFCKNEYVLRMDSDDISRSDRAEKEMAFLDEGYDIVGSYISEFANDDPNNIIGYRKPPIENEELYKFAKKRCPVNHPSVMYRKSKIIEAGNYQPLLYVEDFYLWVRCMLNGCKFHTIPEPLVNMRSGLGMSSRRGGKEYRKSHRFLFKFMKQHKFIGFFTYCMNCIKFTVYGSLNNNFKYKLKNKLLRKKS